jgi:ribonuclease P protein component
MKKEGLPRKQMLKNPLKVSGLFTQGNALSHYPYRIMWQWVPGPEDKEIAVAFSVGKRHYRRATDRNRIKRLMREVYRKQQTAFRNQLTPQRPGTLQLVVVYTGRNIYPYKLLFDAWELAWQKICNDLHVKSQGC